VGLLLFFLNPNYVQLLMDDPIGHVMMTVAGIMLVTGILIMRKMARMKV